MPLTRRTIEAITLVAALVVGLLLLSLLFWGCDKVDPLRLVNPSEDAPAEIRIFLAGNCQAPERGNRIECFDDSTSEPARQLVAISFTLIDSQGITRATERIDPRLVQQREISFRNLAGDTYEVHHVVVASNGAEAKVIYSGLEVWP